MSSNQSQEVYQVWVKMIQHRIELNSLEKDLIYMIIWHEVKHQLALHDHHLLPLMMINNNGVVLIKITRSVGVEQEVDEVDGAYSLKFGVWALLVMKH